MSIVKQHGIRLLIAAIAIGASGALLGDDEPGPFERMFRAMRHAFNEPQHKSKPHHGSSHKQNGGSGNVAVGNDQSNVSQGTSGSVTRPPNEKNTKSASRAATKKGEDFPYGTPVAGKKGFVTSPFSPNSGYIDVRGFAPGTPVKDPYSGKVFLTP